jgi:radical SAM superfamily enzyme YgiQ (UPF0313 family)
MKNILLINPHYHDLEIRWVDEQGKLDIKADYLPLAVATVAALTPPDRFHVDIWDEQARGKITEDTHFERRYDLVGMTSIRSNLQRCFQLARIFKEQGIPVVIGGPGSTGTPDRCRGHFDVIFIGECEFIWPQFLREWEVGNHKEEYRQVDKPDVATSPMPKWDSLLPFLKHYAMGCVQTTRGCPFDCEFCDVIYLNGRRQRHKSIERVIEEVRVLQRLGMSTVMFNDDNLVADRRYCKELMRSLIRLNSSLDRPLRFATQASIDFADDDELVELMADANFYQMLIGIETPNEDALRECSKLHNLKGNMVQRVHKLLSYGMVVRGGLIVGFDHDDLDIFDRQYGFIQECCFPSVSLHMLTAPMGTRLWRRLRSEGRVVDVCNIAGKVTERIFTNVIPKRMSRVDLMRGFRDLYLRVFNWKSFEERMTGWVSLITRAPNVEHTEVTLDDILTLGPALELDPEACRTIERVFKHTYQHAPQLLSRVKEMTIQFVKYAQCAYSLIPKLEEQIELEESGELVLGPDSRPVTVPPAFREAFKRILPDLHRRVYLGLEDKSKVPQVLVDIVVDFLIHELEEGFTELGEQHVLLFQEMADRACAELNAVPPAGFRPTEDDDTPVPSVGRLRLGDDVLQSVEQELLKLAQADTHISNLIGATCSLV